MERLVPSDETRFSSCLQGKVDSFKKTAFVCTRRWQRQGIVATLLYYRDTHSVVVRESS